MGIGEVRRQAQSDNAAWNKLSDKQQAFIMEYLKSFDAAKAAIKAGYNPKNAKQQGCNLLRNTRIRKYIGSAKRQFFDKGEIDVYGLLKQINFGINRSAKDFTDENGLLHHNPHAMSDEAAEQIDGIEQEVTELFKPGTDEVIGRTLKTKYRLVPKATLLKLATEISGIIDRLEDETGEKIEVDWFSMLTPPEEEDIVDKRIEQQKKGKKK